MNCLNGSDEAHHLCHEPRWTTRAATTTGNVTIDANATTTTNMTSVSDIMSSTQSTKRPPWTLPTTEVVFSKIT